MSFEIDGVSAGLCQWDRNRNGLRVWVRQGGRHTYRQIDGNTIVILPTKSNCINRQTDS